MTLDIGLKNCIQFKQLHIAKWILKTFDVEDNLIRDVLLRTCFDRNLKFVKCVVNYFKFDSSQMRSKYYIFKTCCWNKQYKTIKFLINRFYLNEYDRLKINHMLSNESPPFFKSNQINHIILF